MSQLWTVSRRRESETGQGTRIVLSRSEVERYVKELLWAIKDRVETITIERLAE